MPSNPAAQTVQAADSLHRLDYCTAALHIPGAVDSAVECTPLD